MKYVTSDTHFCHKNIIGFACRPYNNIDHMEESLISNWNSVVSNSDTIYHLGDFSFGSKGKIAEIVSKLNGYKILVMGNHDKGRTVSFWKNVGFDEVFKTPVFYEDSVILSHEPVVCCDEYNIHGHIHKGSDPALDGHYPPRWGYNVNVEFNDYKPVSLDNIIENKSSI